MCLTATTSSLAGSLIVGIIALLHVNYEEQSCVSRVVHVFASTEPPLNRWHVFLIYVVFAIGAWAFNVFGARLLDPANRAALFVSGG